MLQAIRPPFFFLKKSKSLVDRRWWCKIVLLELCISYRRKTRERNVNCCKKKYSTDKIAVQHNKKYNVEISNTGNWAPCIWREKDTKMVAQLAFIMWSKSFENSLEIEWITTRMKSQVSESIFNGIKFNRCSEVVGLSMYSKNIKQFVH